MKSILLTLFNPQKAFKSIENEFSDELHRKSIFLFSVYSIVQFMSSFSEEQSREGYFFNLFLLILGIIFSILIMIFLSLVIFWIGKRIGGKAEDIDIEATVAHAIIPVIIGLFIVLLLKKSILFDSSWNSVYLRNSIIGISGVLFLKLLIQGVKKFNNFSFGKSLLAISPIILMNLLVLILFCTL